MAVVTFGTVKGGGTKTTSALITATTVAQMNPGLKITLVDCDPEKYLLYWESISREEGTMPENIRVVHEEDDRRINEVIHKVDSESDLVFVDPEGKATMLMRECILLSDLVVISLQPAPMDALGVGKIKDLLDKIAKSRKHAVTIPYKALFSRTGANKKIKTKHQKRILDGCEKHKIPIFENEYHERGVYRDYMDVGGTLYSQLSKCQKDIKGLENVVADLLGERNDIQGDRSYPVAFKEDGEQLGELSKQLKKVREALSVEKRLEEQLDKAIENSEQVVEEIMGYLEEVMTDG